MYEAFKQHTDTEPKMLKLSAKKYGKSSIAGNLMQSDEVKELILDFVQKAGSTTELQPV